MTTVLASVLPVFAVIVLGYLFRLWRVFPDGFWEPAERITFYVFFPALLVANTARADLAGMQLASMLTALVGGIVLVVALTFPLRWPLKLDGPAFTSLIQGAIRPNVYVAIAIAVALHGATGLTIVSLCMAVAVPLVNAISVVAMVWYASPRGRPIGWRSMLVPIAKNPLILACAAGLVLNVTGLGLPPLVGPLLDILGRAALPIGLLAVGAGLNPSAVLLAGPAVAVATGLKLVVLPVLTLFLCRLLGVDGTTTTIAVLYASMPGSASAYVMARQMGGNTTIMAGVITATTLAASITVPLIASLVK